MARMKTSYQVTKQATNHSIWSLVRINREKLVGEPIAATHIIAKDFTDNFSISLDFFPK